MLNKIIVMGRLTRDPERKATASGISAAAFTLACERSYAPQGKEREVDFIDCIAWRGAADVVLKHFAKGRMMAVEGRLQINPWTAEDGSKRRSAQIVAENVFFADSRPGRDDADDTSDMPTAPADAGFTPVEDAELPF